MWIRGFVKDHPVAVDALDEVEHGGGIRWLDEIGICAEGIGSLDIGIMVRSGHDGDGNRVGRFF